MMLFDVFDFDAMSQCPWFNFQVIHRCRKEYEILKQTKSIMDW